MKIKLPETIISGSPWKEADNIFLGSLTQVRLVQREEMTTEKRTIFSAYRKPASWHDDPTDFSAAREAWASLLGRYVLGANVPKVELLQRDTDDEKSPRQCISHAIPKCCTLDQVDAKSQNSLHEALPELGRNIVLDFLVGARDRSALTNYLYSNKDKKCYSIDYAGSFGMLGEVDEMKTAKECESQEYFKELIDAVRNNPEPFRQTVDIVEQLSLAPEIRDNILQSCSNLITTHASPEVLEKMRNFTRERWSNVRDKLSSLCEEIGLEGVLEKSNLLKAPTLIIVSSSPSVSFADGSERSFSEYSDLSASVPALLGKSSNRRFTIESSDEERDQSQGDNQSHELTEIKPEETVSTTATIEKKDIEQGTNDNTQQPLSQSFVSRSLGNEDISVRKSYRWGWPKAYESLTESRASSLLANFKVKKIIIQDDSLLLENASSSSQIKISKETFAAASGRTRNELERDLREGSPEIKIDPRSGERTWKKSVSFTGFQETPNRYAINVQEQSHTGFRAFKHCFCM